jgi:RNA polymerase sigma factor (sigma-70 family)
VEHTPETPDPDGVAMLSQVLRDMAHRRLPTDAVQDFVQSAELRLLERRHDVLARFNGRSSLRTYLHVVATRLLLDWRNAQYGKWRPSAAAVRQGAPAVLMDRLISRDGCAPDEAAEMARMRWPDIPVAALREMAGDLPPHPPRRLVSSEAIETLGAVTFADPVEAGEQAAAEEARRAALSDALRDLPPEDRWLIRARYEEAQSVQAIAANLRVSPKQLYRRYERMLAALRRALEASGVDSLGTTTSEA